MLTRSLTASAALEPSAATTVNKKARDRERLAAPRPRLTSAGRGNVCYDAATGAGAVSSESEEP